MNRKYLNIGTVKASFTGIIENLSKEAIEDIFAKALDGASFVDLSTQIDIKSYDVISYLTDHTALIHYEIICSSYSIESELCKLIERLENVQSCFSTFGTHEIIEDPYE